MKRLSRRAVLKSALATIALPWLECMAPVRSVATIATPKRLAFMYIPNGVIGHHWFPDSTSGEFELTQSLKPLEKLKNDITVISGLNRTYLTGEPHSQAGSCWLTSARPNERSDGVTAINTTLDQVVAHQKGGATSFPSLELSCNSFVDNMEPKIFDAISWYGPGNDAKSINDPKNVFKRLFGNATGIKQSVLDTVIGEANSLHKKLGLQDRQKLDEYLTSIRSVERRIGKQKHSKHEMGAVDFEMPEEIPTDRGEFIRLMGDLMVLAFRTDQTRIATFMVGPERWETPQLYDGVFEKPVNHHVMTHDTNCDEKVALIDQFHVRQYAYLVEQLKNHREGEGSLLDHCQFVLGSGLGNGARHSYEQLPIVIAGSGGGSFETGRHLKCADGTPLANLWLSLAQSMDVELDRFADSTEPLPGLLA